MVDLELDSTESLCKVEKRGSRKSKIVFKDVAKEQDRVLG